MSGINNSLKSGRTTLDISNLGVSSFCAWMLYVLKTTFGNCEGSNRVEVSQHSEVYYHRRSFVVGDSSVGIRSQTRENSSMHTKQLCRSKSGVRETCKRLNSYLQDLRSDHLKALSNKAQNQVSLEVLRLAILFSVKIGHSVHQQGAWWNDIYTSEVLDCARLSMLEFRLPAQAQMESHVTISKR